MGSNLNTDNAWVENTVVVYHDALGTVTSDIPLNVIYFLLIDRKFLRAFFNQIIFFNLKPKAWAVGTTYKWVELNQKLTLEAESAKYFDRVMTIASQHEAN